jgi:hypothetical protein
MRTMMEEEEAQERTVSMSQLVKRIWRRCESGWSAQKPSVVENITSAHLFFGYPKMPLEMAVTRRV